MTAQQGQLRGFVILTLKLYREGDQWLGECLELGTATFGTTLDEVRNELPDLVALHLAELDQSGEREHFFQTHGIALYTDDIQPEVKPPTIAPDPDVYFNYRRVSVAR